MTPAELRALCNQEQLIEADDGRSIVLIMSGKWGKSDTRLLAGRGSPVGRILSDYVPHRVGIVVQFKASEVLAWLDKKEGGRDE